MFDESDAVGARLKNPSGGKPRKAVAAKRKEKRTMRKTRRRKNPASKSKSTKRPRTRGKSTARKGPTKAQKKAQAKRVQGVTVRGKSVAQKASTTIRNAKRKSVTYRTYKKGGAAIIIRTGNPANEPKAVGAFVVGTIAGIGVSTLLDRWLATRASSQTSDKVLYGTGASTSIHAKADGVRIFAQLAAGGVVAAGAYAARKKMPLLAIGLAGFAGAHLLKAGFMIVTDHVMPMLFKSKKSGDAGDRLFPDRQSASGAGNMGRRLTGGAPLPFGGKPARIGPVATGNVGGCASCRRSGLLEPCGNCGANGGCDCNPFPLTPKQQCQRKVSGQTTSGCDSSCPSADLGNGGGGSRMVPTPGSTPTPVPKEPSVPRVPEDGGDGGGRTPTPGDVPGGQPGGRDAGNGNGLPSIRVNPTSPAMPAIQRAPNPYVRSFTMKRGPTGMYG
jgi:hypothetical protein